MLVLSRKMGQEILIGDNVKITVLKMRGNTVRLGIEAPRDIKVIRGELEFEQPEQVDDSDSDAAQFTVVFDNSNSEEALSFDVSNDVDSSDHGGSPQQSGHLPAKQERLDLSMENIDRVKSIHNGEPKTIRFQNKLPQVIQRNRLQEIVARISNDKKPK